MGQASLNWISAGRDPLDWIGERLRISSKTGNKHARLAISAIDINAILESTRVKDFSESPPRAADKAFDPGRYVILV